MGKFLTYAPTCTPTPTQLDEINDPLPTNTTLEPILPTNGEKFVT